MQLSQEYREFLQTKKASQVLSGFDIAITDLNPSMFEFQKRCTQIALKHGRFALFEDCGLGKTIQQLEWAQKIVEKENKPVIILAPLSVVGQTIIEGSKFNYNVERFGNDTLLSPKIYITNYEHLSNIDTSVFVGVVLDESSIIKNFDGKTRNLVINKFRGTKYKSCYTATPSPNDPMELGNHAEFLDIMTRNEMLSMYFVHDGGDTSKWRLKKHAESKFWAWVSSWAIMINKPSDIGFSDDGYVLPKLNLIEREIATEKRDNGRLFNDVAVSATNFNNELRLTMKSRIEEAAGIANSSNENFIIWVKHNNESEYLKKLIPDAVEVTGSEKPHIKESKLIGFGKGEFRVLITKTKIAQFGLNYQNCANQIFASLDFSFEGLYQAIRRSWRFGQTRDVNIHIITTDTMKNVRQIIEQKQKMFEEMQNKMVSSMGAHLSPHKPKRNKLENITVPQFLKIA